MGLMKKANSVTALCDLAHTLCKYKTVIEQPKIFVTERERHKKWQEGFRFQSVFKVLGCFTMVIAERKLNNFFFSNATWGSMSGKSPLLMKFRWEHRF